ncbi:DoxX family membrane protein [Corynebacterium sp. MSK151]|uniref:DoxX family membrane protein n=1 Tax=unclassified Corynebacterium TaxID=2624378 RepID=UPI00254D7573|nr:MULTISPECIES: DoxX family membrane protein [unclassified Corynebacterium]MDK8758303.1 DoxX family membrane protein [Corynebacterium sp. MSK151]MDK8847372.1 DoxX family membrane protein [Corynebacterium sp. MSK047]
MSDSEKYPNDRALENVEDGFDDDLDVPTYRKLAEPMNEETNRDDSDNTATQVFPGVPEKRVAEESEADQENLPPESTAASETVAVAETEVEPSSEPEPEVQDEPKKRYDAYAAAGRTAPQVISPAGRPSPRDEQAETESAPAADKESEATEIFEQPARSEHVDSDEDFSQPTQAFSASEAAAASAAGATANKSEAQPAFDDEAEPTYDSSRNSAAETQYFDESDFAEPAASRDTAGAAGAAGVAGAGVGAAGATAATTTAAADDDEDTDFYDDNEPEFRRGTTDFGLLLLRLGLGALLLVHGLTTLLGWGNSGGTTALETQFSQNNFALGPVMATAIPTVQLIAGALLILGLATPLAAALALALSAYLSMFDVATSANGVNIVGQDSSNLQLQLLMTAMALGLQFTGPGRIGIDFGRGWARRPLASSWIFGILSIAAAIGLWWLTTGTLPFVG